MTEFAMKAPLLFSTFAAGVLFATAAAAMGGGGGNQQWMPPYPYPPACDICRVPWQVAPREVVVRPRAQHHYKRVRATADAPR
jgi:hypothetical protein